MKVECWMNVYPEEMEDVEEFGTIDGQCYYTKDEADAAKLSGRVACIKLTGVINIETSN
jgi:hypothetical protein